ncbi:MAG: hypothetical protein IJ413_03715 [Bacteroides sp.]|nr:hypothetical protein [Bacteroides sp.]
MELKKHYQGKLDNAQRESERIKKRILHISLLRVFIFIAGFVALCMGYDQGGIIICGILLVALIPFLLLIKLHNRLYHQKDWHEASIRHYRAELASLINDYSAFDGGKEWIDASHPFSLDLDVFGEHSLFQCLNRTCTPFGKETLSRWLRQPLNNKVEIETRQQAIQELGRYNDFRETFRITGCLYKDDKTTMEDLKKWIEAPSVFLQKKSNQWICWAVPCINILLFTLGMFGVISMSWFGLVFCTFTIASSNLIRKITRIQESYNKTLKMLSTYAHLIELADKQSMKSTLLVSLKQRFESNGKKAPEVLGVLSKELDRLDLRNNLILYALLEGSMFWQLRQMLRIERWKQEYGTHLLQWLEALGKLDALCALGTFAFNHPEYTYPNLTDEPFVFQAKDMGHPLMPRQQCVVNDADIPQRPYFLIITGANMAGKSTYLRTIGCNYILACIGAPVCCSSLRIYPAHLMTSLRTSDSLANNESYFFAELKRLQQILERLKKGEEMFIILDEILKGTNSMDKQKGSFSLVKQLLGLKANGIIATHDLLLGELKQHFPNEISNYCFEADIQNDELTFSYKLREGIAQNMNACFLMQKMGISIE